MNVTEWCGMICMAKIGLHYRLGEAMRLKNMGISLSANCMRKVED